MAENEQFIPPASFEFLVQEFVMRAQVQLGALHFGEEKDRPEPNLPWARHAIDTLALLLDKTRGNLTMDEQRLIENSLTELRFHYVRAVEEAGKRAAADEETPAVPNE
ncbi:MAG: DUF1844 domain-containing protein [Bryobacteraceae bacterium]